MANGEIEVVEKVGFDSSKIIKEINKAFKEAKDRKQFIEGIREALHDLATGGSKFGENDDEGQRTLTAEGKEIINNAIVKVANLLGAQKEDIKEFLYLSSYQVVASFKSHSNYDISKNNMIEWKFPRSLYIKADLRDISFIISEARYMVEMPFDEI